MRPIVTANEARAGREHHQRAHLLRMATRTEMEVRLWATAIWSQLSSYALVDPMWQEPFRPEGVTREAWGAAFADFICARVFRELKYRGAPA